MEENKSSVAHGSGRKSAVWLMLMVNVVFILLLMTLAITAFRVGNYLPEGIDILFIVGKEPNMDTTDGNGNVWQSNEKIPLFSSEYVNGENRVTIASQNGDKVIAPGFESSYEFALYNNGNMAVVHETDLDFKLKVANSELENYTFPLKVRLYDTEGNYIIGSKTEWIPVEDASIAFHPGTLGATSYKKYTLELKWEFEGGQDELDTLYGNEAGDGVWLTLGINTYAEEHLDPTAQGGIKVDVNEENGSQEYGGTVRWLWLALLFINTGVLIFYVAWLMSKRQGKW